LHYSHHFRPRLEDIPAVIKSAPQKVLLSATLPNWALLRIEKLLNITQPKIVRASVARPDLTYRVVRISPQSDGHGDVEEIARRVAVDLRTIRPQERIMVFGGSQEKCRLLSERLGLAGYHHSKIENPIALRTLFENWVEGNPQVIVCSPGLGVGVNKPFIARVYHVHDALFEITSYHQETGRGSRTGTGCICIVVLEREWTYGHKLTQLEADTTRMGEKHYLQQFLATTQCRRRVLSSFLDLKSSSCADIPGCARCDNCERDTANAPSELKSHSMSTRQSNIPPILSVQAKYFYDSPTPAGPRRPQANAGMGTQTGPPHTPFRTPSPFIRPTPAPDHRNDYSAPAPLPLGRQEHSSPSDVYIDRDDKDAFREALKIFALAPAGQQICVFCWLLVESPQGGHELRHSATSCSRHAVTIRRVDLFRGISCLSWATQIHGATNQLHFGCGLARDFCTSYAGKKAGGTECPYKDISLIFALVALDTDLYRDFFDKHLPGHAFPPNDTSRELAAKLAALKSNKHGLAHHPNAVQLLALDMFKHRLSKIGHPRIF
jgi:hypothetical protein